MQLPFERYGNVPRLPVPVSHYTVVAHSSLPIVFARDEYRWLCGAVPSRLVIFQKSGAEEGFKETITSDGYSNHQ